MQNSYSYCLEAESRLSTNYSTVKQNDDDDAEDEDEDEDDDCN